MLSTGVTLNADQWDGDRQCVCNHPRRLTLQRMIGRLKLKAEDAALDLAAAGLLPTLTATELRDQIKAAINGDEYRPPVVTLLSRFAVYAETKTNTRTREIYLNTARMIERMTGDVALDSVNRQWLAALDASLTRAGIATNTRAIHFRNIRAVMNDAIDNDLTTNYPFRRFAIRREQTAHRVLSVAELRRIFSVGTWHTEMFRLSFLLIGMNAADLYELTAANVDHDRITYRRRKTHRLISVRIEPEAASIIERNSGCDKLINIADRYSNVHNFTAAMGKALGTLHDGCTLYYARHTWATVAYSLGIGMDTISRALGHSFSTGAAVTSIYVKAGLDDIDAANRRVIDYVTRA